MRLWFWGWLIVAVSIALVSAFSRSRASAPFAVGAAAATALEAFRLSPSLEWIAFAGVSSVVFIAMNRASYQRKHHHARGRHAQGQTGDDA